jgi:acyl dehydratase
MPNAIRLKAIQGLRQGDSFSYRRKFSEEETVTFGDLTRDYNPVHYDIRWAKLKRFKGLICHGLLVGSMICEFGGQVGWLATGMNFKFIKPVYFGDSVTCHITIVKIRGNGRAEAEALFENQENEQVAYAYLKGLIPLEPDRKLLKQMVNDDDPTNKLKNKKYSG